LHEAACDAAIPSTANAASRLKGAVPDLAGFVTGAAAEALGVVVVSEAALTVFDAATDSAKPRTLESRAAAAGVFELVTAEFVASFAVRLAWLEPDGETSAESAGAAAGPDSIGRALSTMDTGDFDTCALARLAAGERVADRLVSLPGPLSA
jgi:hypothetical protein